MKILKPIVGGHDGSSFRELLDLWKEQKLCEVIDGPSPKNQSLEYTQHPEARPWIDEVGNIMLYDNPILDKLNSHLTWKYALWANEVKKGDDGSTWIFWPKHPKIIEILKHKLRKSYDERPIDSIFIGTTTTLKRTYIWNSSTEKFWLKNGDWPMKHEDYLQSLSFSKFGLCLPGVGPKCLRDAELMSMGTVPIFTPGCSLDYISPPQNEINCFVVSSPDEMKEKIANCSKDKWKDMSAAAVQWYEENCSPQGSFTTTVKLLESKKLL